jgi:hypothetical protein
MTKLLTMAALAGAVFFAGTPAFAQSQGSNQAADYALSWGAASGDYGRNGSYARYGYDRYPRHRDWR